MTPDDILRRRLENQRIARSSFRDAEDVVAWFGAMQAQDYLGSLWAIGLRMKTATEATVESAETRRAIIRTWPMRGTLHFLAAADVRWMTRLLAPRVLARNTARMQREFDVDAKVVGRSREVLARALEGGRRLERAALYKALEVRRISTGKSRGLHILLWLAMDGTLCLAGRQGKQHTFALLEEWIPKSRHLERDEALSELARRYFASHGPATLRDFMWWAGVTAKDAQAAIDGAKSCLAHEDFAGRTYWWRGDRSSIRSASSRGSITPCIRLLPAYDEYAVAYQDRSLPANTRTSGGFGLLSPIVIIDGRVIGTWKRTIAGECVNIEMKLASKLTRIEADTLRGSARSFARFLGLEAKLKS